jgi:hypothetical protein
MPRTTSKKKCFVKEDLTESLKNDIRGGVCKDLPVSYTQDGKSYCVLHYPSISKIDSFNEIIAERTRNNECHFSGCYFPSDIFFSSPRSSHSLMFMYATFASTATFMGAFEGEIDFRGALFDEKSNISFNGAELKNGIDLRYATIRGGFRFEGGGFTRSEGGKLIDELQLVFEGANAWLDLQYTTIEKPERIVFHTVRLQPNWFVNVDCRKFVFTDCRWFTAEGDIISTESELEGASARNGIGSPINPYALLTKTCLQLAENYESNKDYQQASLFRQIANESRRFAEYRGYKFWSLHWWYWLSSFYGESWRRAALWLVILIVLFTFGYASSFSRFVNSNRQAVTTEKNADEIDKQMAAFAKEANEYRLLDFPEALFYSLRVGSFQRPEPQPANNFARGLVAVETILVPLQGALLAFAIRRRFMQ